MMWALVTLAASALTGPLRLRAPSARAAVSASVADLDKYMAEIDAAVAGLQDDSVGLVAFTESLNDAALLSPVEVPTTTASAPAAELSLTEKYLEEKKAAAMAKEVTTVAAEIAAAKAAKEATAAKAAEVAKKAIAALAAAEAAEEAAEAKAAAAAEAEALADAAMAAAAEDEAAAEAAIAAAELKSETELQQTAAFWIEKLAARDAVVQMLNDRLKAQEVVMASVVMRSEEELQRTAAFWLERIQAKNKLLDAWEAQAAKQAQEGASGALTAPEMPMAKAPTKKPFFDFSWRRAYSGQRLPPSTQGAVVTTAKTTEKTEIVGTVVPTAKAVVEEPAQGDTSWRRSFSGKPENGCWPFAPEGTAAAKGVVVPTAEAMRLREMALKATRKA